jgi:SdpI/YfhL protein family
LLGFAWWRTLPELHLVGYILPLVTILTAIPMALGVVPPNRFYGFRTPQTLSSPEVWYPANRASGRYLTAASAISLVFNLTFWWTHAEWPIPPAAFANGGGDGGPDDRELDCVPVVFAKAVRPQAAYDFSRGNNLSAFPRWTPASSAAVKPLS